MTYENTTTPTHHRTTEPQSSGTGGALTEIGGIVVIAVVAMGLLTFGYNASSTVETAQTQQLPAPAAASEQMTDPPLPRATGADTPAAPTTSTSGQGASSGN
ncbi:MAG: hypothetical protein Q8M26_01725 [Pseudolabrys sp.]|nr:hypothetical protein [Pseudolabrys sp.]